MEFRKCMRCGCFFIAENDVCLNCMSKDMQEINRLNSYIEENNTIANVQDVAVNTGISVGNINRFIKNDMLKDFNNFNT